NFYCFLLRLPVHLLLVFVFYFYLDHLDLHSFPTRRSSDLIPMINAGAGTLEHPTQCMLDVYTLYEEFGSFEDLNIVIAGDIKHSRVAHSNIQTLKRLGANVYTSCAPEFQDPTVDVPNVSMDEAVTFADCMMLLRIQHERHEGEETSVDHYLEQYGL